MVEIEIPEKKWQQFYKSQFDVIDLPEVEADQLSQGLYTNAQIAEYFKDNPFKLIPLLTIVEPNCDEYTKRSILSQAVDEIFKEKQAKVCDFKDAD